jgi:hypothetical protein
MKPPEVTEKESRQVAEASRQVEWEQPSFLRELFLGNFRLDLIHPFPGAGEERPEFLAFYEAFREFLRSNDDRRRRLVALDVLAGRHLWLEAGSLGRRAGSRTAERRESPVGVP